MNYGYARVSTTKQGYGNSLEEQLLQLFEAGCDEVIEEKFSAKTNDRPQLKILLEKLKEHIDGNYKYIDEVALIDVIDNDKEASDLLVRCKGDRFVYHTSKEDLCMEIVNMPILRGRLR